MLRINFLMTAVAALVPLVIGFIWYNPKIFGKAWMNASGMTEEKAKGANMAVVFGVTYLVSFLVALVLNFSVIHQFSVMSVLVNEPGFGQEGSEINTYFMDFMAKYGNNFRTFKHGALHGFTTGLLLITPVITVNALFERKGFKYIALNSGFWIVSLAIMGGIICASV
ncbi:MAG: DUF1761 domain-containing protein [Bacteroidia bacterium]